MMATNDVIILDVRTRDEFNTGHLPEAVLLPDYEISEKAESVVSEKNQIILVYCRSGRRSESASKTLIDMGYTEVYDIGGIQSWTGEIISPDTGTVFYNYFGGGLPDDLVTPIDFVVTKRINGSMQEFEFRIEGTNIKTYGTNGSRGDNWRYYAMWDVNRITKLTISSIDGSIMQEFSDLETANEWFNEEKPYGLSFDDWNFDGYLDVSLWKHPGGTSGNYPHYYWLWDNDLGQFVANTQLEEISDDSWIEVDNENYQIVSHSKFSSGHRSKHFEYRSNEFVMVLSEYAGIDMDEWVNGRVIMRTIIEELIDGKIVVIEDNSEDITESYWNNVSGMVRQNGLNNEGLVCYSSGVPFSAFLLGTF